MRIFPQDHPLQRHMSQWDHMRLAKVARGGMLRNAAIHCQQYLMGHGMPAYARVKSSVDLFDCFIKADDDLLGWVNFAPTAEFPSAGFMDAPIVLALALNCLPPRIGMWPLKWMEFVGCAPPQTRPILTGAEDGVARQKFLWKEDAGVFLAPERQVLMYCLLPEVPACTRLLADFQLEWAAGHEAPVGYDESGQVLPEERWTPLALEVYQAWQDMKGRMDVGQWTWALEAETGPRSWKNPKSSRPPRPPLQMSYKVRKAFVRKQYSLRHTFLAKPPDDTKS